MDGIYALSLPGWFLLGLTMGLGPCMAHQMVLLLPYISMTKNSASASVWEYLYYTLARSSVYCLLGFLSGAAGGLLFRLIRDAVFLNTARGILGGFLILLALSALLVNQSRLCRIANNLLIKRKGRAMAVVGFLTALVPCPALLGLMAYSVASGRMAYGALSGLFFALGSSITPILLMVPLLGFLKKRLSGKKGSTVFQYLGAFLLFAYGVHLLVTVLYS